MQLVQYQCNQYFAFYHSLCSDVRCTIPLQGHGRVQHIMVRMGTKLFLKFWIPLSNNTHIEHRLPPCPSIPWKSIFHGDIFIVHSSIHNKASILFTTTNNLSVAGWRERPPICLPSLTFRGPVTYIFTLVNKTIISLMQQRRNGHHIADKDGMAWLAQILLMQYCYTTG